MTHSTIATYLSAQRPLSRSRPARTLSAPAMSDELDDEQARRRSRAARVRDLRINSPYTQQGIANRMGISLRGYQKWEERGVPDWDTAGKLADLHRQHTPGITREYVWQGETPQPFADSLEARLVRLEDKIDRLLELEAEHARRELRRLEREVAGRQRRTPAGSPRAAPDDTRAD